VDARARAYGAPCRWAAGLTLGLACGGCGISTGQFD
jgi:hypothetical protein